MNDRFENQIQFLIEIDKIKSIFRKNKLFDKSRHENDAEHSWHIAMMATVSYRNRNRIRNPNRVFSCVWGGIFGFLRQVENDPDSTLLKTVVLKS